MKHRQSKTSYIEMGKLQGHSDKLIEINIIKEYLIREHDKMRIEINHETENAEIKNIPHHLISIFRTKLEERKNLINHLLQVVIDEYWKICKDTK